MRSKREPIVTAHVTSAVSSLLGSCRHSVLKIEKQRRPEQCKQGSKSNVEPRSGFAET